MGLPAQASFGGGRIATGRVIQLSLEHIRFSPSTFIRPRLGQDVALSFELEDRQSETLKAEVIDISGTRSEYGPEIGLRPLIASRQAGKSIIATIEALRARSQFRTSTERSVSTEMIDDSARVYRIWEALTLRQCHGRIRTGNGAVISAFASHVDLEAKRVSWTFTGPKPSLPFELEVIGHNSSLACQITAAEISDEQIIAPFPTELLRTREDRFRRTAVKSPLKIRFTHPIWPEVTISRNVQTIAYDSVGCITQTHEDALYPGMLITDLQIEGPGQEAIRLQAEVCSISNEVEASRCKMLVRPTSEAHTAAWEKLVEEHLHPRTDTGGEWNEACWDLYENSGYFHLSGKEPEQFAALKRQWFDTQKCLAAKPRIGFRVVRFFDDGSPGVEASLSLLRPYTGSWFAHQLARQKPPAGSQPRSGRDALWEIYLRGFEPVQTDPTVKWLFAYYEAHVRWTQFAKFEFISWYEHTGQACLFPFQLMEGDATRTGSLLAHVELSAPTDQECELLLEFLEESRPKAYREALDLVADRLDLASIKCQWTEAKLSRERELMVARVGGRPIAMAVMETAHPGLNLFNVLDGVHLYPLTSDEASASVQDAYLALLDASAAWYRARGRNTFVHYAESQHLSYAEAAGLKDLGAGKLWIISSELLPEFIEHLCEATQASLSGNPL
jgi:predicted RecB family endonuclease